MPKFFRYWFYPLLLIATLAAAILTMRAGSNLQSAFAWFAFGRLVLLFVVEWLVPMRKEWAMTWRSFLRDLKYAVLLGGGGFLVKFAAGWLAIGVADNSHGALSGWPVATIIRGQVVMRDGQLMGKPLGRPVKFAECLP